ncbi:MAG: hypothetical protein GWN00_12205 [Aliifodinibius sp.]|nr:hypothetical protein [Fodinibius sp.]NIV11897.1 hypothetical protein [Fodinibius sp.]NIY25543.1 hypothetical protein [Fodinibius sp.]
MKKYLIRWNAGYGEAYEYVELNNIAEAERYAFERWKDEVESNADYSAEEATEELLEEYQERILILIH